MPRARAMTDARTVRRINIRNCAVIAREAMRQARSLSSFSRCADSIGTKAPFAAPSPNRFLKIFGIAKAVVYAACATPVAPQYAAAQTSLRSPVTLPIRIPPVEEMSDLPIPPVFGAAVRESSGWFVCRGISGVFQLLLLV